MAAKVAARATYLTTAAHPLLPADAAAAPDTHARLAHGGAAALPPTVQRYIARCTPPGVNMQQVLDADMSAAGEMYWRRQQFQFTAAAAGYVPPPPPIPGEAVLHMQLCWWLGPRTAMAIVLHWQSAVLSEHPLPHGLPAFTVSCCMHAWRLLSASWAGA
jgi:hypothetical protein